MSGMLIRIGILVVLVLTTGRAGAEVKYTYTGEPFTIYESPYEEGDKIDGWFEIDEPLEPYLDGADISGFVTNYRFQDGVLDLPSAQSSICDFRVWTNGIGAIKFWSIVFLEAPTPGIGEPQDFLMTANEGWLTVDQVGEFEAGGWSCPDIGEPLEVYAVNFEATGTWVTTADTTPQPTVYSYQGHPFSDIEIPNEAGDEVSGTITLDGPLLGNMDVFDIGPYVTSFSFTDGQDQFNESDGVLCSAGVGTDRWGRIESWDLLIAMNGNASDSPQRLLRLVSEGGNNDGDIVESGTAFHVPCVLKLDRPITTSSVDMPGEWDSEAYPQFYERRYRYRGEPYEFVGGTGEEGGRASGYVRFAEKLPPNLEMEPLEEEIVELWFSDSMQIRTLDDSKPCDFRISTDADGEISEWEIILREIPKPAIGDPQYNFEIRHFLSNKSSIGLTTESNVCGNLDETDYQRTNFPGTWQVPDPIHDDRFEQ